MKQSFDRLPVARMNKTTLQRALRSLLMLTACGILCANAGYAQQRPLITEDVEIVRPGAVRVDIGFDFAQDRDFTLSGLNGDLTRIGVINLRLGMSPNVELEAGGVLQNFLSVNRQYRTSAVPLNLTKPPGSTNDIGDFYLATKFKLKNETRRMPALAFRFGVQLPNTNQERGIGLNQTNFFATAIAGKHFGRLNLYGNIGLGINTAPVDAFAQNDVLLYGLAGTFLLNNRITLVSEINGRISTRRNAPRGTESDGEARLGARIRAGGLSWDVAGIAGINQHSLRSGVTFGVTYDRDLFTPVK